MRAIFSSARIETAEGVASFLRQAGIPVLMRHGRSYHSRRSGQFSYTQPIRAVEELPSVWVCDTADQVRARALLLQAKLVESTRPDSNTAQDTAAWQSAAGTGLPRWQIGIRIGLLAMLFAAIVLILCRPDRRVKQQRISEPASLRQAKHAEDDPSDEHAAVRVHLLSARAQRQ